MINRIAVLYSQLLATEVSNINGGNSSTASCKITIGKITGDLTSNCTVIISNSCGASNSSLTLLDVAYQKIIRMNNSETLDLMSVYSKLREDCVAEALLNQNITIHDINLGVCKPRFPVLFNFINSGNATSNCLMNSLINKSLESISSSSNTSNTSGSLDLSINQRVNLREVENSSVLSFINNNFMIIGVVGIVLGCVSISQIMYKIRMNSKLVIYRKQPNIY
jgi:hypothetical protein